MADEPQHEDDTHTDDTATSDVAADESTPSGDHEHGTTTDDDAGDAGDGEAATGTGNQPDGRWKRVTASVENLATIGQLVLHYEARDVSIFVDGDCAMRIMAVCKSPSKSPMLGDRLDVRDSPAGTGWVLLAPTQPLAVSWVPGLPREPRKVAFDPAI